MRADGLIDALADLLLPPGDALFLQACFAADEPARAAWRAWSGGAPVLPDATTARGLRVLAFAPLVLRAAERGAIPLSTPELTALRARRVLERRRGERYRQVLSEALHTLARHDIAPIVLKGVMLADAAYPDPVLRHCHDIDLVVTAERQAEAVAALSAGGFSAVRGAAHPSVGLLHTSRLPLMIHTTFCRVPAYRLPAGEMWTGSVPADVEGVRVRRLSTEHTLVHLCVQGLGRGIGPAALRWAIDARHLLGAAAPLDWPAVVVCGRAYAMALPLAVALTCLRDRLDVTVDACATGTLGRLSARRPWRDAAVLIPLLPGAPRTLRDLARATVDGRSGALVAAAMLVRGLTRRSRHGGEQAAILRWRRRGPSGVPP